MHPSRDLGLEESSTAISALNQGYRYVFAAIDLAGLPTSICTTHLDTVPFTQIATFTTFLTSEDEKRPLCPLAVGEREGYG